MTNSNSRTQRAPSGTRPLVAPAPHRATRLAASGRIAWREAWIAAMEETDTTQECIAAVLGVSRQRVGNVIGGNGPSQAQLQRLAEDPATCNLARAYVGRLMNTLDRRCPDRLTNDEIVEAIGRAGLNALAPFMRKAGGG